MRIHIYLWGLVLISVNALGAEQSAADLLLDRLIRLEARVNALESEIASRSSQQSTIPITNVAKDKVYWRANIKRGLTIEQVRNYLGEPTLIRVSGNNEYWTYASEPTSASSPPFLEFQDGKLRRFQEPN
jgi:hypothetical protein